MALDLPLPPAHAGLPASHRVCRRPTLLNTLCHLRPGHLLPISSPMSLSCHPTALSSCRSPSRHQRSLLSSLHLCPLPSPALPVPLPSSLSPFLLPVIPLPLSLSRHLCPFPCVSSYRCPPPVTCVHLLSPALHSSSITCSPSHHLCPPPVTCLQSPTLSPFLLYPSHVFTQLICFFITCFIIFSFSFT